MARKANQIIIFFSASAWNLCFNLTLCQQKLLQPVFKLVVADADISTDNPGFKCWYLASILKNYRYTH